MLSLEQIRHMPSVHEYYNHQLSTPVMDQHLKRSDLRKAFSISIEHTSFDCFTDPNGHPVMKLQTKERKSEYRTLKDLLTDFPKLSAKHNELKLAKIANFFFKGELYSVIDTPQEYIEQYLKDVEAEGELFELPPNAITRHGVFDVEEIQLPRIKDGQFIFYVSANIPYKVSFPIPMTDDCTPRYELLPYH